MVARAVDASRGARAFHWPLEFPDIFLRGKFDVVLGNPPWERIKLQEQEFFAARDPEIAAAPNAAARGKRIAALAKAEPGTRQRTLACEFESAKRLAEASSVFARESGRFPLTGRGDVNTYALFAELFSVLASPRGRAGVIVPTGIATDATTAPFFAALVGERRLSSLHDFQTGMGFFDRIGHARFKFSLMTTGAPQSGPERPSFSFFARTEEDFSDPRRHFSLSAGEIARMSPNTLTAPTFRTAADAELTAKIYDRVPVLIDEAKGKEGNPWGVSFMAMFHMSNDSGLFRMAAQLREAGFAREGADWRDGDGRYVPLYEAKMIHQFDHRWATYDGTESRDATLAEKQDPEFEPTPRYWVPEAEVADRLRAKDWTRGWLMGWRDICRSTDERTVIAAALPRVGVGHTAPLLFIDAEPQHWAALGANLDALVLDYAARQKV
ncbi:MAG: Eco57I restriction-modification methylase domain-containing protein, partial [Acetobacteraceae bacterium]